MLVVAAAATAIYFASLLVPKPSFEFSIKECEPLFVRPEAEGITETYWENDTTLLLKANVAVNCAMEIKRGEIEIIKDTLSVVYVTASDPLVRAKCFCGYKLTYRIFDIQQMDYIYSLEKG